MGLYVFIDWCVFGLCGVLRMVRCVLCEFVVVLMCVLVLCVGVRWCVVIVVWCGVMGFVCFCFVYCDG